MHSFLSITSNSYGQLNQQAEEILFDYQLLSDNAAPSPENKSS